MSTAPQLAHGEVPDPEIVARVRSGDVDAFSILIRRHSQRLFRVALSVLRNDAEAEEIVQDAFVRAYTHLAQFEGRAQFSTWLARIAFHAALARQQERRRFLDLNIDSAHPLLPLFQQPPVSPERHLSNGEVVRAIAAALETLPLRYRECIRLVDLEHLSRSAAAGALNITRENLKVRLHRARRLLQQRLSAAVRPQSTT